MNYDNFRKMQRWAFIFMSVPLIVCILAILGVIPHVSALKPIAIVAAWAAIISFCINPMLLIVRHFLVKKNLALTILSTVTLLSFIPFLIQHKTHESRICTCCDEYFIPEDIMEYILIFSMVLASTCYVITGYLVLRHKFLKQK